MLKHLANERGLLSLVQPPSGGCVLKRAIRRMPKYSGTQPPSGGCVLKQELFNDIPLWQVQPPSGGCVLKHTGNGYYRPLYSPAAFGRLCVET